MTAEREINRALAALMRYKRPVYLEIPRDLVLTPIEVSSLPTGEAVERSDPAALAEAIAEVRDMLTKVERPVILAGAEVHRFGVQEDLARLVERLNAPVASTLLGKSAIREDHPLYLGSMAASSGAKSCSSSLPTPTAC